MDGNNRRFVSKFLDVSSLLTGITKKVPNLVQCMKGVESAAVWMAPCSESGGGGMWPWGCDQASAVGGEEAG